MPDYPGNAQAVSTGLSGDLTADPDAAQQVARIRVFTARHPD